MANITTEASARAWQHFMDEELFNLPLSLIKKESERYLKRPIGDRAIRHFFKLRSWGYLPTEYCSPNRLDFWNQEGRRSARPVSLRWSARNGWEAPDAR